MSSSNQNPVSAVPTAPATEAVAHFRDILRFETDCWDVHASSETEADRGYVLLDVRSTSQFARSHLPGAVHLPHRQIDANALTGYPPATLFVVYCAGPHCNAAARAAIRLAELERPVKLMAGGIEGWRDEGFNLVTG